MLLGQNLIMNAGEVVDPGPPVTPGYNFAAFENGADLPAYTNEYVGPIAAFGSEYYPANGCLITEGSNTNNEARSFKDIYAFTNTWVQASQSNPFQIVIDLGAVVGFRKACYYQPGDGWAKLTHARLYKSADGTLKPRVAMAFGEGILIHDYEIINDNLLQTEVTFDRVAARYIMVEIYNTGAYGGFETGLHNIKLFDH